MILFMANVWTKSWMRVTGLTIIAMYFFSFFVEYCILYTVVAHASLRNEAFDSDALGKLQRSCQSDDGLNGLPLILSAKS